MSDKRSVTTDALDTLGSIIDDEQKRDAIHLAVEPIVAVEKLYPGQDVGLVEGGAGRSANPVGIVDPFLKAPVQPGERFWLVVYPRQITSLRHVWEHSAFDAPPDATLAKPRTKRRAQAPEMAARKTSKLWIASFANNNDIEYDHLIQAAKDYLDEGTFLVDGGRWEGHYIPDEFWPHFESVTGRTVPDAERGSFFSCAC